ncbi:taurine ABC transporter substrate-binding protein [Halanaerobacter jeridensis]|uniref:Taurine transport system substrate-binding protein n=1 Tax=Halanaerobacter jeridensis TaxID=706427 RepID=A0A938XPV7_9FIRM|nr:aliphatic sulfonate ABC transporter substrate-binding protein [Halanaerobacter jeridensis]MBM7555181.1 taurine transport system substrate-binding protein [Halanaerobacter jeridensis]
MNKEVIKKLLLLTLIGVMSVSLVACGGSNNKEQQSDSLPDEINFGILRVPNDETIAMVEEMFEERFGEKDIEVNFTVFDSGSEANQALASGSIDFATMGNVNAVTALSRDLNVEMIWIHEVLGDIEALAVKNNSEINKIEDLAGKKVAVPFASTCHYVLLNALNNAGVADEVQLLDMQTAEIVAAWERGDIDAAYVWQPSLAKLLESGRVLVSSKEMAKRGYVTANVEVVNKDFAAKYPQVVTSFITMLSEAADIYRESPEKAASLVSQKLEITPQEALKQMQGSTWLTRKEQLGENFFGTSEKPGDFAQIMKQTSDFLKQQNSIQTSPSQEEYNQYVNPKYIERSLEQGKGN